MRLQEELAKLIDQCGLAAKRWYDVALRLEGARAQRLDRDRARDRDNEERSGLEKETCDLSYQIERAKDLSALERELLPLENRLAALSKKKAELNDALRGRYGGIFPRGAGRSGLRLDD